MGGARYAAPGDDAPGGATETRVGSQAGARSGTGSGMGCAGGLELRGWKEASEAGTTLLLDLAASAGEPGANAELSIGVDGSVRLRVGCTPDEAPRPDDGLPRGPFHAASASARSRGGGRVGLTSVQVRMALEIEPTPLRLRVLGEQREPICEIRDLQLGDSGAVRASIALLPEDGVLGLGGMPGPLERRGRRYDLDPALPWREEGAPNTHAIPSCLVHRLQGDEPACFGVLLDTCGASHFDVGVSDPAGLIVEAAAGFDLMILPGPRPQEVAQRLGRRLGWPPPPPLGALGHHLAHGPRAAGADLRDIARASLAHDIPTDAIHVDADAPDGSRPFQWDPARFPDPRGLVHSLASHGVQLVRTLRSSVPAAPDSPVFASGSAHDAWCRGEGDEPFLLETVGGPSALPDFDRPDVRDWWGRLHAPLVEDGVAGVACEPGLQRRRRFSSLRARGPAPAANFSLSTPDDPSRRLPYAEVGGAYAAQRARATRSGVGNLACEQRAFVVSSEAGLGSQRHAALALRTRHSDWEALRASLASVLGLGLSGISFAGPEVGGSRGRCNRELYARWMQMAALAPLSLSGAAAGPSRPWQRGHEPLLLVRDALRLRMRLLPYLYALFRESERSGAPIWRPLSYEFPNDREAARTDDQLMLGPSLLAAPVLEAGLRERELYLPPGVWIDWQSGARYLGSRRITLPAPLDRMPLLVRGGSVLPTRSPVRNVLQAPKEPLVLEVFPGGDASLELVEDDGMTLAYRGAVVARTPVRLWHRAGGRLRLEIGRSEGPYTIAPRPVRVCIHASPSPHAVYLDGGRLQARQEAPGWWRGDDGRLHVRLENEGLGCAIELDPAP